MVIVRYRYKYGDVVGDTWVWYWSGFGLGVRSYKNARCDKDVNEKFLNNYYLS